MGAVTIQARGRRVHGYSRGPALYVLMAACALARLVRLERAAVCAIENGIAVAVAGEGMAIHAVGVNTAAETLLGQARRVFDGRSRFVARRATTGRNRTDGSRVQCMTGVAGDPVLCHVHAVPRDAPVLTPVGLDVDPSAGGAAGALLRARARLRATERRRERKQADPRAEVEPN
jgi:hypothetical protein